MADVGVSDDQAFDFLFDIFRLVAKACLIALMLSFSVEVLTDNPVRAVAVGLFFLVLALFNTWRRFLEPISLFVFCIAVVCWCDREFATHVSYLATLSGLKG